MQPGSRLLEGDVLPSFFALVRSRSGRRELSSDHRPRSIKQRERGNPFSNSHESLDAIELHNDTKVVVFVHQPPFRPEVPPSTVTLRRFLPAKPSSDASSFLFC
jgi:hypothetical protein